MVLFPFKGERIQRYFSIILILIGTSLLLTMPIFNITNNISINGFILGIIISFVGVLYLFDL